MRDLAAIVFATLDGVMQAPAAPDEDTSGGFQHGGWAAAHWGDVMEQVWETAMKEPYDLLLGRKTYESFAAHWPNAGDNPVANRLNGAKKYVVSSTLKDPAWSNSVALSGDVASEVTRLKAKDGPLIQTHGSWQLIQALLAHDLLDELRLWTFPVVVGPGKRLFEEPAALGRLSLSECQTTESGVVLSVYRFSS